MNTYWQIQTDKSLFKDLDFAPPEQKSRAGSLALIGGNSSSFRTISYCAAQIEQLGVSNIHTVLPDSLKKTLPPAPNITFAPSEPSGGLGKFAEALLSATIANSQAVLLPGDLGKNSETSIVISSIVKNTTKPTIITRDTIDLITPESAHWLENSAHITLFASLPQLQKLFRTIYYPKVITLSMPTNQLIETLHKFTLTYDLTIATIHNDQYIAAGGGDVVTTPLRSTDYSPISIWQGSLASRLAVFALRQPTHLLEAATTAILPTP